MSSDLERRIEALERRHGTQRSITLMPGAREKVAHRIEWLAEHEPDRLDALSERNTPTGWAISRVLGAALGAAGRG